MASHPADSLLATPACLEQQRLPIQNEKGQIICLHAVDQHSCTMSVKLQIVCALFVSANKGTIS